MSQTEKWSPQLSKYMDPAQSTYEPDATVSTSAFAAAAGDAA
ncbi:hypothetical protein [Streptomyces sp. NBC_00203]